MIFFPSFRRKSSFAAYALGPSWLTIFLLSSRLCFLASSYSIDASCRNYKGHDISGDMQQAINEIREMATNAVARISRGDPSTIHLLESLFGKDPARYRTVSGNMETLALSLSPSDFVIICDDLMVNIEPDLSTNPTPDPRGIWVDNIHKWHMPYDEYRPCNPLRKAVSTAGVVSKIGAKVILDRYIYLCPDTLDRPKGRSLAPYKDQVLAGKRIDDYVLTPSILFHELLHTDPRVPVQHRKSLFHLAHGTISLPDFINTRHMGQLSMKNYEKTLRCTWPPILLPLNSVRELKPTGSRCATIWPSKAPIWRFKTPIVRLFALSVSRILTLQNTVRKKKICSLASILGLYLHRCDWGARGFWGKCVRS